MVSDQNQGLVAFDLQLVANEFLQIQIALGPLPHVVKKRIQRRLQHRQAECQIFSSLFATTPSTRKDEGIAHPLRPQPLTCFFALAHGLWRLDFAATCNLEVCNLQGRQCQAQRRAALAKHDQVF